MRPTDAELRAISKKYPYPDYIIIPAAGSLVGDGPAIRTLEEANALAERIIRDRGAGSSGASRASSPPRNHPSIIELDQEKP